MGFNSGFKGLITQKDFNVTIFEQYKAYLLANNKEIPSQLCKTLQYGSSFPASKLDFRHGRRTEAVELKL